MRDHALDPVLLPDEVWERPETVAALRERRIGYLFGLARKYAGASQTRIANVTAMDQGQVSRIMSGDRQTTAIDVLERVARGLSMPDQARAMLGLAPLDAPPATPATPTTAATPAASRAGGPGLRRLPVPVPVTELFGRDRDIDRVTGLLTARRLVTLVGPPGIGKTRLAIAAAETAADRFTDGAVFIPLADTGSTDLLTATIARHLDITDTGAQPLLDTLTDQLRERHLLLILDNFEHLLDAAPQIATLLAVTPRLHTLITSRERLRVSGEQVYPVPALTLPDRTDRTDRTVEQILAESSAVALFTARAAAADNDFTLTPATIGPIAELCQRLDGLPLAIELAAARTATFTPDELRTDLAQRLDLISDGPRDLPTRQQTLHAAIDWSHHLLSPDEQTLLARLSVFTGGCITHAAHHICTPDRPEHHTRTTLGALVEKHLLRAIPDPEQRTHYQLLETIRVYAIEQLAHTGETPTIHHRHAHYYETFTTHAATELQGPHQATWINRIEREYPNLQTALTWALTHNHTHTAATIATSLERFWWSGSDIGGGRRWYDRILAKSAELPGELHVRVLLSAALLAFLQGDLDQTQRLAAQSLDEARGRGDRLNTARALHRLGAAAGRAGDYARAQAWYGESLDVWRELDDPRGTAATVANLGAISLRLGDLDAAAAAHAESLELFRSVGDSGAVLICLENLGEVRLWQGDAETARPLLTEALAMSREHGDRFVEAGVLCDLGWLAELDGRPAEARRLHADALAMSCEIGWQETVAASLHYLAGLALADAPMFAVHLLGAATGLLERLGLAVPPIRQPVFDGQLATLRTTLPGERFDAAWADGRAMAIDETIARALAWARQPAVAPTPAPPAGATSRTDTPGKRSKSAAS